jgi:hypothetical protein
VRITPAGRELLRSAPRPPTALLIAGLDSLGDDELHALAAGLLRLTEAMGLAAVPAPMLFADENARAAPAAGRASSG